MLRLQHFGLLVLVAFAVMALAGKPAIAQTKIAIVDVEKLLTDSDAAKSIQKQIKSKQSDFQDEIAAEEKKLRKEEARLVDLQEKAQGEAAESKVVADFEEDRAAFQEKVLATRQLVQEKRQSLRQAAGGAIGELQKKILKVVSDVAESEGYDVVLTKENVILAAHSLDITDEVMSALNKAVKTIDVKVSSN